MQLTKKQKKEQAIMNTVYVTVHGRLSILDMIKKFGPPIVVLNYAKIECKTKSVSKATIKCERYINTELKFSDDIVIKDVSREFATKMEYSGIKTKFIRHPRYNPMNPPTATEKELREWKLKYEK